MSIKAQVNEQMKQLQEERELYEQFEQLLGKIQNKKSVFAVKNMVSKTYYKIIKQEDPNAESREIRFFSREFQSNLVERIMSGMKYQEAMKLCADEEHYTKPDLDAARRHSRVYLEEVLSNNLVLEAIDIGITNKSTLKNFKKISSLGVYLQGLALSLSLIKTLDIKIKPKSFQMKYVKYLFSCGLSASDVQKVTGISRPTLTKYNPK